MNLFTELSNMLPDGVDLNLNIRKKGGSVTVSIIPKSQNLEDSAQHKINPLIISGTPEELDAGFLNALRMPLGQSTGLLSNMADYEKSVKEAEANSKAEKERKEKEKKEAEALEKKIRKLMEKADECEKAEDYRGAIKALTEAVEFSDNAATLKLQKRISGLKSKLNENSLFGGEE